MSTYGFPTKLIENKLVKEKNNENEKSKLIILKPNLPEIRYEKPHRSFFRPLEMAMCFVFFNPAKSVKLLSNYLYTIEKLRTAGIPFYTLELSYGENFPEIKKAFHIRTNENNVMFHKEQLCHLLEKRIPWQYTKLCFADADIIFENASFYDEVCNLLNENDIVQPFYSAKWVNSTYQTVFQERKSCALMNKNGPFESKDFHPGFAWAFKRSWFQKVGFFQHSITGSGDTLSVSAWLRMNPPKVCNLKSLQNQYKNFCNLVEKFPPSIACGKFSVYHMWHGTHFKRQYVNRHLILRNVEDIDDILEQNSDGLFEFNYGRDHDSYAMVKSVSNELKKYFEEREDDEV
jgi:hypothetical protein